jgi:hypothetical protein
MTYKVLQAQVQSLPASTLSPLTPARRAANDRGWAAIDAAGAGIGFCSSGAELCLAEAAGGLTVAAGAGLAATGAGLRATGAGLCSARRTGMTNRTRSGCFLHKLWMRSLMEMWTLEMRHGQHVTTALQQVPSTLTAPWAVHPRCRCPCTPRCSDPPPPLLMSHVSWTFCLLHPFLLGLQLPWRPACTNREWLEHCMVQSGCRANALALVATALPPSFTPLRCFTSCTAAASSSASHDSNSCKAQHTVQAPTPIFFKFVLPRQAFTFPASWPNQHHPQPVFPNINTCMAPRIAP